MDKMKSDNMKPSTKVKPELAKKFLAGHLIVKIENQEQLDTLLALAKRTGEELAYWCVTVYKERYPYISCSPGRGKILLDAQSLCLYEDRTLPFSAITLQERDEELTQAEQQLETQEDIEEIELV